MRRVAILALALLAGCATVPEERPDRQPPEDRTDDPEFVAAREAARPEFETQADALAAGVYERFVHPDSVRPVPPAPERPAAPVGPPADADGGEGDPSTAEILGTLPGGPWYDRTEAPRPDRDAPAPDGPRMEPLGARDAPLGGDVPEGPWTLQLGAYNSETGALVRIRQLEREFPDVPRWYTEAAGLWRVYLGRWADRDGADRARRAVALRGYTDAWVTRAP